MAPLDDPTAIDWKALWREIDWDNEEHQKKAAAERLNKRARQYASLPPEEEEEASKRYVLTFLLGKERYAIDVRIVRTVRSVEKLFPVPGTPHFYPGVMNVRGQIVTVLDLRLFFEMHIDEKAPPREVIVVTINNLTIGLLAHHVYDVISVPANVVESIDDVRYAHGVTSDRLVLLDIARMFEDSRLIVGGIDE